MIFFLELLVILFIWTSIWSNGILMALVICPALKSASDRTSTSIADSLLISKVTSFEPNTLLSLDKTFGKNNKTPEIMISPTKKIFSYKKSKIYLHTY